MNPSVCLYAPSGWGKSTLALQFAPERVYYIGTEREAIAPAYVKRLNPHWPRVPDYVECLSVDRPFEELMDHAAVLSRLIREGKKAIGVLDTLSSWADREMFRIHRSGVKDDYGKASNLLHERLTAVVNTIMAAGGVFIALAHLKDPSNIDGKYDRGGPRMPGKSSKIVPSLFSMVLRGDVDVNESGVKRRVFRVDPLSSQWFTKDRYEIVADGADADLVGAVKGAVMIVRETRAAAAR